MLTRLKKNRVSWDFRNDPKATLQSQAAVGCTGRQCRMWQCRHLHGLEAAPAVLHACRMVTRGSSSPATTPLGSRKTEAQPLLPFCRLMLVHWIGRTKMAFRILAAKESGGAEGVPEGSHISKPQCTMKGSHQSPLTTGGFGKMLLQKWHYKPNY